jgi:hypothetical protein
MTIKIRPGILVSLKTEVHDKGLSYDRKLLESDANVEKTLVTRTMKDPEEHTRAIKARGAMRSVVEAVCAGTPFGLLCPQENRASLDAAIAQAREIGERHRRGYTEGDGTEIPPARYTSVGLYVIKGEIASTDEESANAIAEEMRRLLATVNEGIDRLDVDTIRDAATKAKEMAVMLSPEAEEQVSAAVKAARAAARTIVARVEKRGEDVAEVLSSIDRSAIASARMAFIDLDETASDDGESMPAVSAQRFAAFDAMDRDAAGFESAGDSRGL